MALVTLKVPYEAAMMLEGVEVPGERLSASDMHVTLLYMGKGTPLVEVARAMLACHEVARAFSPFLLLLNRVGAFPEGEDGTPIILPVMSPVVMSLQASLKLAFQKYGMEFSDKFPDFKPHVTLSYLQAGENVPPLAGLPGPLSWVAHEMMIWGGDAGESDVSIRVPFVLSPVHKAAARLTERLG